ncbi:winged helix-turn-helix transcriptional regulator [Streptomyces incarnatus]|nr:MULTISPECIES: winged helix-turn-helix transcriptional regulator [Streptomyces]
MGAARRRPCAGGGSARAGGTRAPGPSRRPSYTAARLQTLTAEGILDKRRYQESPPRDEYVLTERGIALWPTLRALGVWGRDHFTDTRLRYFRHAACGTELGPYGECARCGTIVPVADVVMEPGPGLDPDPADPVSRALLKPRRLLEPMETDQA